MNDWPNRETVERIRSEYPVGSRVELLKMDDIHAPPIGTKGTVNLVDDAGTIFCNWDNGSGIGVVYGHDSCRIINS